MKPGNVHATGGECAREHPAAAPASRHCSGHRIGIAESIQYGCREGQAPGLIALVVLVVLIAGGVGGFKETEERRHEPGPSIDSRAASLLPTHRSNQRCAGI